MFIDQQRNNNLIANIEVKARLSNFELTKSFVEELCGLDHQVLIQEDSYFFCKNGRLKLRKFSDIEGELIFYDRKEEHAAKKSLYSISKTPEPDKLKSVLSYAFNVRGIVNKKRLLFIFKQTRIHLDKVEGLGEFLELEFVMGPRQVNQQGIDQIRYILNFLRIMQNDLLTGGYLEMLENRKSFTATSS